MGDTDSEMSEEGGKIMTVNLGYQNPLGLYLKRGGHIDWPI